VSASSFGQDKVVYNMFEFENECQDVNENVSWVAFCGKCSRPNQPTLFSSLSMTLDNAYYVCFAYKVIKPITQVIYTFLDAATGKSFDLPWSVRTVNDYK
jgi:hypothetical protein